MPRWLHRRRRPSGPPWLARASLALAALLVLAGCSAGQAIAPGPTPTVAPTPAPPLASPHMVATLTGVSMVSRDEGWITGSDGYYNGIGSFLLHYHDGGWRLEQFPALVDRRLATPTSIAMVAADTGWITVALGQEKSPVILHESAGSWTVDRLPDGVGMVTALSAVTAQDAWALSASASLSSGARTGAILRYHAGQWTAEATLPGASLAALSMDSASDGWAAGSDSAGPLLLHHSQGAWARVTAPALAGVAALTGVFMASSSDGWATGLSAWQGGSCTECGSGQSRVVLRFHDGNWTQIQENSGGGDNLRYTFDSDRWLLPNPVAAGSDGSGWVARGALVYFAPNGRQQVFTAPCQTDLIGMGLVPSSAGGAPEGWVIGSNGQIFHFAGGALTRYNAGASCYSGS